MSNFEKELITRGTIADKVNAYKSAMQKLDQGYDLLRQAEQEMKAAFSVGSKYDTDFAVLPGRHSSHNENVPEKLDGVKDAINRKAWRALYDQLEIDRVASIKRRDEISKQLDSGQLPEITIESIYEIFETLNQNVDTFARESVLEVYKWLRPEADSCEMRDYKTNQKNAAFELKDRIIKRMMVNRSFHNYRTNYYNEKYLIAMDKVFFMLDGKNMLEKSYRSPLVDAINTSELSEVETEYFQVKMYGNGNLHIHFLRMDLVQKFNAVAGGAVLKP